MACAPFRSFPRKRSSSQFLYFFCLVNRSAWGIFLATERIRAQARSAVVSVSAPGVFVTVIPLEAA